MKSRLTPGSSGLLAALGLFLAMPAIYFVSANVLKYELNVLPGLHVLRIHTGVLLGGPALAVILNLWPVLRLGIRRTVGVLTIIITLRARPWNLVSLGLATVILGTLLFYGVVENFGHI